MKILTLTTLYPNASTPNHGVFVENRLRAFRRVSGADVRVVAPVPFFPSSHRLFGRYADFAAAPLRETRHGVEVRHPRYAIPPKIAMTYAASALERCFAKSVERLLGEGWDFDLVDAHYLYPDGVAAARVARRLGKPLFLTARGTDVNLIPKHPRQRAMILQAVRDATGVFCVARALKEELIRLGAPAEKISVLRNGVDLTLFRPRDRNAARAARGLGEGPVIASVGHLIDRKGHDVVIRALALMPNASLVIAGEGEMRRELERLAAGLGLGGRVRFLGAVPHADLCDIYSAADALALGSSREGWPNVLLEAMACGAPAVAAPIWGCGEVIAAPAAGRLAADRSPEAFAAALQKILAAPPGRAATRRYAERFSWAETAEAMTGAFSRAIDEHRRTRPVVKPLRIGPAAPAAPRMLVTVDTEEAFDWKGFEANRHSICPPEDIDAFQRICVEFGAKPIYFLTHPVIDDPENAAYFARLHAHGAGEPAIHMHQWVNPPDSGYSGEFYSFQMNLPAALHHQKLTALQTAFARAFGFRPRAHRAGRYGIGPRNYADLAAAGIRHDFSPSPAFDQSASGGPDFSGMSNMPFAVNGAGGTVFVTPVPGARAFIGTGRFFGQNSAAPGLHFVKAKPPPLSVPGRLSCEGMTLGEMKGLTRKLLRDRIPVLTFSIHSTSLSAGKNPYAPDAKAVARTLSLARDYLDHFANDLGGTFITLDDLEALYHC